MEVSESAAGERVLAEAWSAGASGAEERAAAGGVGTLLLLYAPADLSQAVERAARRALGRAGHVGRPEPVASVDWSEAWKRGLAATIVSERLAVRPSFAPLDPMPGRVELIIDPGQAFGTGSHASTALALRWIDELADRFGPESRVLDVGTGTGVLALAALALGAGRAVAFDSDPIAAREAAVCARRNDLAGRVCVFAGTFAALRSRPFDLVVANLLRSELLPLLADVAAATTRGGVAVVSGLLAAERDAVEAAAARVGFALRGTHVEDDATGDRWIALRMDRS